jgi:hypothetical protein
LTADRRGRQLDGPAQVAVVGLAHQSPRSIVVHARSRVERAQMVSVPSATTTLAPPIRTRLNPAAGARREARGDIAADETEVPARAGSTRSSLVFLYRSKRLAATGLRREPAASAHASAGHPEQSSPKLAADDCSLESCALTRRVLRLAALPVSGRSRVRCSRPGSGPSRRPTGRARCRAGRRPRSWLRSRGRSRPRRP